MRVLIGRSAWSAHALGAAVWLACCAAAAQSADSVPAARQPKWEAGIGGLALTLPEYPASDEYRSLLLPLPYFVYRGRVLRADEQGSRLRRRLAPYAEIDVSGGGALASDSSGSDARRGMPDLGYLVELGPNLRLGYAGALPRSTLVVNLPLRGVVSIGDPGVNWRGLRFVPELAYRLDGVLGTPLSLRLSLAAELASGALHDYFYTVEPRYATAARPAYAASAGYLGSSIGARVSRPLTRRLRGFATLRYYNYDGSASADSPLFRAHDGYTAALGLSWSLLQSREPAFDERQRWLLAHEARAAQKSRRNEAGGE